MLAQCSCGPNIFVSEGLVAYQTATIRGRHRCFGQGSHGEGEENDLVIRSVSVPLQALMSLYIAAAGLVTLFFCGLCIYTFRNSLVFMLSMPNCLIA